MKMNTDMEQIEKTLKEWGWNAGDFEELIVRLAEGDGFYSLKATVPQKNFLSYEYRLNSKGKEIAREFAWEYGYTPIEDFGCFEDDNPESVANTLEEWGWTQEEEEEI